MMDVSGGCGLNGGGGGRVGGEGEGQGSGPRHGMITLEDLEAFSEDQLADFGTGSLEEREMMEEDEGRNRLLSYWQEVARGHRIEVPTGKRLYEAHVRNNLSTQKA